MGKNTPNRQEFIIANLKVEIDEVEEKEVMDIEEDSSESILEEETSVVS